MVTRKVHYSATMWLGKGRPELRRGFARRSVLGPCPSLHGFYGSGVSYGFLLLLAAIVSPLFPETIHAFTPHATKSRAVLQRHTYYGDSSIRIDRSSAVPCSSSFSLWAVITRGATEPSVDLITCEKNGIEQQQQQHVPRIPFVIERLPREPPSRVFDEISDMCIDAFFNAAGPPRHKQTPPQQVLGGWTKEWQLAYLRNLQRSDLKVRRQRDHRINMMFVARRVVPATAANVKLSPLLLDLTTVHNLPARSPSSVSSVSSSDSDNNMDYVCGELIGFVEVTQRPYGLGDSSATGVQLRTNSHNPKRPVLTNLSVRDGARASGVGSQLMKAAEEAVQRQWRMDEMILEVEDDNVRAQEFYQRRGYRILFEDPASRRYDTSGLFLQQIRCKRIVMRKDLLKDGDSSNNTMNPVDMAAALESTVKNLGAMVLQRFRDGMFNGAHSQ